MKSFEPQHDDDITSFRLSSSTIVHALKEISATSDLLVLRQSFISANASFLVRIEKIEYHAVTTLSITQVFDWQEAFSEGREVVENLPHALER